ncbi:MAG: peptidyl-prolyl cis-trans isomerase SurA [Marinibacterium sp.]|nr:peptidyl-prolyl cis-trans isomerase SurA [Marinibacterium sp.]
MQLTPLSPKRFLPVLALALSSLAVEAPSVAAQGLFSPAIRVNNDTITRYELQQRARFLSALRAPGNPETEARKQLIEDRLKVNAARGAGITVSPEEVELGMTEFAGRANLSLLDFQNRLEEGGIDPSTFRDFTESGLLWRDFVRARFLGQARPSEAEIDRALGGSSSGASGVRVLISEIIIPMTPQTAEQVQSEADRISRLRSADAFSAEARRFSATASRDRGGRMDWMPLSDLPVGLQSIILSLSPGEVTEPLPIDGGLALFQLRDIAEAKQPAPTYAAIEYATYFIPGGRSPEALSEAAKIAAEIDTCDDLYGIAKGQPEEVLQRQSLPPSDIPRDIAIELAKLDDNEISTALTRANGQTLMLLMLCGRTAEIQENASRQDVANALTQQRLGALADGYLQQLQAEAVITDE